MKVLIFGRNGQVAQELQRSFASLKDIKIIGSSEANFTNTDSIVRSIRNYKPTHVINAAAYTAVDKAEQESELAFKINGHSLGVIGEEAKKLGAFVVHYSTDYVFDGSNNKPYIESDETCPLGVYGQSKLMGERFLADCNVDHIVLRVSWVYGAEGNNFLNTMLRLGSEREELKVVDDQIGAPTWSRLIADSTLKIVKDINLKEKTGIYHLSSQGQTSWYQFASNIFEICRRDEMMNLRIKVLRPIPSGEYPTPARRPKYSLMNSNKVKEAFGVSLPDWSDSLEKVMKDKFSR